jgi:ATP-dependent Clp protease adaptor protein ClpS
MTRLSNYQILRIGPPRAGKRRSRKTVPQAVTLVPVPSGQDRTDGAVKERVKPQKQDPTLYKVVLLNDDYTTMDFVVRVLETIFQKSPAEAYRVMMQVHLNGSGIAGVYAWEVAETKVEALTSMAREAEFPLRATIEEA